MKIFLTGIRGFIARHLTARLRKEGHVISGFTSKPTREALETKVHSWKLGDPVDDSLFRGIGTVVHCLTTSSRAEK